MESHAPPGTIQVTERTFERLRELYELRPRGAVEVKGKGLMSPYLLLGRRGDEENRAVRDVHERAAGERSSPATRTAGPERGIH